MSEISESPEKPAGVLGTAKQLKENFPDLGLSTGAVGYLERFDHGQTDGITCWRYNLVEGREGSAIEGRGLFAVDDIKEGEVVAIKPGHVVDSLTIKDKADIVKGSHQQIGPNQFLTGLTPEEVDKNLVGYNHSCDPNAKVIVAKGVPLAFLIAKRPIQKGEELTTDYSVSQMSDTHRIFLCRCGSEKCRGVILPGNDWLQEGFQKDYAGDFPWFIQEEIDRIRQMSEPERRANQRQILTLRTADAINLLANLIENHEKQIAGLPAISKPFAKVLSARTIGRERRLLFEYAKLFAKVCPFANIEEFGIDRNNLATVQNNMGKVVEFARNLDRHFN